MDYEKKYNEALERARKIHDEIVNNEVLGFPEQITDIFPELRESEDEKVIKALETFINQPEITEKITFEARIMWLSWLEKQKENPKNADSIPADCASNAKCEDRSLKHTDSFGTDIRDTPAYWRGWDDAMKQKEQKQTDLPAGFYYIDLNGNRYYSKEFRYGDMKLKVGEQKPAWSEDIIRKAVKEIGLTQHQIDWFKTNVFPPKQEWSEEDEKMIEGLITRLNWITFNTRTDGTSPNITFFDEIDWLKSLRPQPKQEWSEELDTDTLREWSMRYAPDIRQAIESTAYHFYNIRPHWKPSEEQMNRLCAVVDAAIRKHNESVSGYEPARVLKSLYEQLKKL